MLKNKFFKLFLCASILCVGGLNMTANAVKAETAVAETQQNAVEVRGVVSDSQGPVVGATVMVVGTKNVVATGIDGDFVIKVAPGQKIKVSFIGYTDYEMTYNGEKSLSITIKEDFEMLSEVVVTALGVTKQAKAVGYATTRVSTEELQRTNTINPVAALQGKVAGVNINLGGASGVTSSSSITIRGAKSIDKNNSPIFVIDGMIIQEPLTGNLSGTDWGSQLKNLNPNDYESVTVLKGAAATALYGSRGANGAIVIVSKGGQYNKKGLGVEVNQTVEWTNIYKSPIALQNVYGMGAPATATEGDFADDGTLTRTTYSFGPKMDGSMKNQYSWNAGTETPYSPHPDNWRALFQNGLNNTTNVALNGGGENTSFRISYGYTDNNGVFKNNEFKRHTVGFRTISKLNKVFSVEGGFNYAFSRALNGASQGGWDWNNNAAMIVSYYMPRNIDLADYVANYRDPETHAVETNSIYGSIASYLHQRDVNVNEREEQSLLANLKLKADIAPWLDASIKANYNLYYTSTMSRWAGTGANYGPSGSGGYSRGGNINGSYNFLAMLHSGHSFMDGDLTLDVMAAYEMYGNTYSHSWSKGTNGGLVTPGFYSFSNSKNLITPSYNFTKRNSMTHGISGIINLGWKDQLFLEITGRNDWVSSLAYPIYAYDAEPQISVFYPSVNASWVFTESFEMPEWFSFGKLRASLARVGMGTSAYATSNGLGVFNQGSIYDPNRNSVLYANPNLGTVYNKTLKPEIQQSIEIGTDLRFWDERIYFDFAYYKTNTFNQIMNLSSVAESGANRILINAGNIQNQGIEMALEVTPVKTSNIRWTIGGNFTLNRGKVIKLHEDIKEWNLMGAYDAGPEVWAYEGGEFGVFTTPYNSSYGGGIYKDEATGKPVLTYFGRYSNTNPVYGYVLDNEKGITDRKIIGKVEPNYIWSMNTSFSWKDLDFYAQVDGRVGGNYYSNSYKYASQRGTLLSSLEGRDAEHNGLPRTNYKGETVYNGIMLDGIFDEGTMALAKGGNGTVDVSGMTYEEAVKGNLIDPMMASMYYYYNLGWGMPSELGLQENTWISLREISIGYRLPKKWCNKIGMQQINVNLIGRNLCYLYSTLKDDLNPESISSNNPLQPIDIGGVPFYRTFSVALNLKF